MAEFGDWSEEQLSTVWEPMQEVARAVILRVDFRVQCGRRSKLDQDSAFEAGTSHVEWDGSYHNWSLAPDGSKDYTMADAYDLIPYPVEWPNQKDDSPAEYIRKMMRFYALAKIMMEESDLLGVPIYWGGQFKGFFDGPHFQRIRPAETRHLAPP